MEYLFWIPLLAPLGMGLVVLWIERPRVRRRPQGRADSHWAEQVGAVPGGHRGYLRSPRYSFA